AAAAGEAAAATGTSSADAAAAWRAFDALEHAHAPQLACAQECEQAALLVRAIARACALAPPRDAAAAHALLRRRDEVFPPAPARRHACDFNTCTLDAFRAGTLFSLPEVPAA